MHDVALLNTLVCLQVYIRLQRLFLSLSHQRTLAYLDKLGDDFDAEVRRWKCSVEESLTTNTMGDA